MVLRIFLMATRALRTNFFRSLLATVGVMIGVGAVVSAVSILEGSQKDVLSTLESFGADQVIIFNGTSSRGGRNVSIESLVADDATEILDKNVELVKSVSPQYQGPGQIKYFEKNVPATVFGVGEAYSAINKYDVEQGQFFSREDVRAANMVAVLGHKVAVDLFGSLPAVGHSIKINGKSFIVAGVMEEKGSLGFQQVDDYVFVPISTAMTRLYGQRYLSMIVVQAASAGKLQECIDAVTQTLRDEHGLKAGDENDFQIWTQGRFKQEWGRFSTMMKLVLYSIAGISMIVGGIGIMNIMMVSVTERTREIGVRMAVGARRWDILMQFLIEAIIISFVGGGTGVVCGWGLANLLSDVTEILQVHTPFAAVVVAVSMAVITGLIAGVYPAFRASRLDPVKALRYE